jgi:protein-tyrosine phosphatase
MTSILRHLVSGSNRRFTQGTEFDLDLTYITPRMIAMGFPSVGIEANYRNPADKVAGLLEQRHPGHFKIYNLSEREHTTDLFGTTSVSYPFPDHHAPSHYLLLEVLRSMHKWLAEDPENIVVCHCLAGHGRTGVVLCCLLLYEGLVSSADEALSEFARIRSTTGKGIAHPSQKRYVQYAEMQLLETREDPVERYSFDPGPQKVLTTVQITQLFNDGQHHRFQCIVFDSCYDVLYNSSWFGGPDPCFGLNLIFQPGTIVTGDFTVKLFGEPKGISRKPEELLRLTLCAKHIGAGGMALGKMDLDGPHKDVSHARFDEKLSVYVILVDVK